jgi:hypothetical protein
VLIQKPRLRRMKPFVDDVQLVVRRWLEEHAPDVTGVRARTLDERFEIRNPFALPARARARTPVPSDRNEDMTTGRRAA